MTEAEAKMDPRVVAIRADRRVGRGTCSSIDECWEARELVETLDQEGIKVPETAVRWAHEREGLWLEQGANCTSGEPDCPLVAALREWDAGR